MLVVAELNGSGNQISEGSVTDVLNKPTTIERDKASFNTNTISSTVQSFLKCFLWLRYKVSGDNLSRRNSILSVCNGWQVLIILDIFTVTQCLQCPWPASNCFQGCPQ